MTIDSVAAAFSGLAVLAGGANAYFAMRIQRDMANLKSSIMEKVTENFTPRKEQSVSDDARQKWETEVVGRVGKLENLSGELQIELARCQAIHGKGSD